MRKITLHSCACLLFLSCVGGAGERPYREAALQTARWLRAAAIRTSDGLVWAADPNDTSSITTNLYSGSAGVVLFFIEAYRSTGDSTYLSEARAGADYLLAFVQKKNSIDEIGCGLYTGAAGIGFTLGEIFKATGESKFHDGMRHCAEAIRSKGESFGTGIEWPSHDHDTTTWSTDIIGGSAGTGLFLLYAARELYDSTYLELAVKAGRRLIEAGQRLSAGIKWASDAREPGLTPVFPRLMPNFSHGTAGIAYFLATLYRETHQQEFLAAATEGGRYLQSIAVTDSGRALIFHDEPDNKNLFYLGWCHGPAGTARLFYRLYQISNDERWMEWVKKSARADLESGIPELQTPGFWNNVSQCCGSAGVAEFFLNLYRVTKNDEYLSFAKRVTGNLLSRATQQKDAIKWIQAEHRVKPDLLAAQTGYMEGAAGIGMWLLHLDAFEQGKSGTIVLPDSPF